MKKNKKIIAIKNIIIILYFKIVAVKEKKQLYIENVLSYYIPPFKYIIRWKNDYFSYEIKEKQIFTKNMPNWYNIYENSFKIKIFRVLSGFWLYFSKIHLEKLWDVSTNTLNVIDVFNMFIFLHFFLIIFLKFFLRIYFFKELTSNSPFNVKNCFFAISKNICITGVLTIGLGFGSNTIDVTAERNGYVPPFQHYSDSMSYYVSDRRITKRTGTMNFDDFELLHGNEFPGANYIRNEQITTQIRRRELNSEYVNRLEANAIRQESQKIRRENS